MNLPTKSELTAPAPAVREPVLHAIGENLLKAPTKLTSGWVNAAARLIEQLLEERKHLYTGPDGAWPAPDPLPDVSVKKLCGSIEALLSLDAAGALVPHGIGGHARTLLKSAAARLCAATPACSGCGSKMTDAELATQRSQNPDLISCCPDRKMVAA